MNTRAASSEKVGKSATGLVRVGIGGWNFAPWRDNFYPAGLAQHRELAYASRALTAIEVNSTYYSSQKPATFAKWRDETPDDFVFSLKASRYATNRRVLAEAGESVDRFVNSGIAELGPKLGPIVWQFATTKAFDPVDFGAFLALLPPSVDGLPLRHVMEVRHASFKDATYLALARQHQATTVFADSDEHPSFADPTGPLVYARLMRAQTEEAHGYPSAELDAWAERARTWARGDTPADLPHIDTPPANTGPREVYVYFINGAKERAPAAAQVLIERLASAQARRRRNTSP